MPPAIHGRPFGATHPWSRLPEDEVDDPAPADVTGGGSGGTRGGFPRPKARSAAMVEDLRVLAPGVLQRVGQDRHRGELAGVVHLPGEGQARSLRERTTSKDHVSPAAGGIIPRT